MNAISTMLVRVARIPSKGLKQYTIPEIIKAQTRRKCVYANGVWVFGIQNGTDADIITLAKVGIIVERC